MSLNGSQSISGLGGIAIVPIILVSSKIRHILTLSLNPFELPVRLCQINTGTTLEFLLFTIRMIN